VAEEEEEEKVARIETILHLEGHFMFPWQQRLKVEGGRAGTKKLRSRQ
jgi:hypothetical protein